MRGFLPPDDGADDAAASTTTSWPKTSSTRTRKLRWPTASAGASSARKTGPRKALYKNLIVAVLRYEQIKTTEARAKEVRGQVEKVITLAKDGSLAARRRIIAELPERAARHRQADQRDRAQVCGSQLGLHPASSRSASVPATQLRSSSSSSSEILPDSWPAKQIAREGGAVRYRRTGRIRRHGLRRIRGATWQRGRSRVSWNAALARLSADGRGGRVEAAGRTDAGVHAAGQVIAFTYYGRLTREELGRALQALLPADIGLGPLRRVAAGFRPRYRARWREYRYTIWNGPPSPLRERMCARRPRATGLAAMADAAQALVGRHDFSAFGGGDRQPVRTVHRVRSPRGRVRWSPIDVVGDAFLRQMVRRHRGRAPARRARAGNGGGCRGGAATAGRPAFAGETAAATGTVALATVTSARPTDRRRNRTMTTTRTYSRERARSSAAGSWSMPRARRSAARLARRRRPRGQAQADLRHAHRHAATTSSCSTPRKIDRRPRQARAKTLLRHSGYPGGFREETLGELLARRPEEVIRRAVKGMLPHNKLGAQQLRKLKVYAGAEHPHEAQLPEPLPTEVRQLMSTTPDLLLRHRPSQDQRRPRPAARRRGRGRRQRPLARGALRQRRRPGRDH